MSRTLITSITTLLALFSIYIFGGEILKGFSFAMIVGVIIGTYSSIFVAAPVLNYTGVNQKTVIKDEIKTSPIYSATKNMPNFIPEYSVW